MPPKEPPVETTAATDAVDTLSQQLKAAYEKGYVDGYEAAFPKPSIFEACKRDVVKLDARDELQAIQGIRNIMAKRSAEYGEKMPTSDENLLLNVWRRTDAQRRADAHAPQAPRQSRVAPTEPPKFEYEVIA